MNNQKGFAAMVTLFVVLGIIVVVGGGYVAMNPEVLQTQKADDGVQTEPGDHQEVEQEAKHSIVWRFTSATEVQGVSQTAVTVLIDGTPYDMGTFDGSCSEIGATGGVDGKGLLAGELSAAQCWFAGGGKEIGVFAHEDGGFDIMVGELSEGEEGAGVFRGDFKVDITIP
jgi:hypothetical protein